MEFRHEGIAKVCPRCGASFVCTHDTFCQCVGITLNENARAYLGKLFRQRVIPLIEVVQQIAQEHVLSNQSSQN